jgi:hypothetical protein
MLELQLSDAGSNLAAAGGGAAAQPLAHYEAEIPDQLVLHELSSRLSRLDSQKRRVLLDVPSKLDVLPAAAAVAGASQSQGGPSISAEHAFKASQPTAQSLGSSRRSSRAGGSAAVSTSSSSSGSDLPAAEQQADAAAGPSRSSQEGGASNKASGGSLSPAQGQATAESPGKSLMSKLAALRLGRGSSLWNKAPGGAGPPSDGGGGSSAEASPTIPTRSAWPGPASARPTSPPRPPQGQPLASATQRLQALARQRSRLSADRPASALRAYEAQLAAPAAAARLPGVGSTRGSPSAAQAAGAGQDALTALERAQQQEEEPPSLAASPTVLALGAWQQMPDSLDVAAGQPASRSAGARSSSSRAVSGGAAAGGSAAAHLIPRCPAGRVLELRISSTWGDHHYVGLAGIELFDAAGQALAVSDARRQVSAAPHSINVLPEYGDDPRTPDKLLDGEGHVWVCVCVVVGGCVWGGGGGGGRAGGLVSMVVACLCTRAVASGLVVYPPF